jgi:hypothetical protein|tara:strand:- start:155 stop:319 length:165 start_codon:yes stop_codon:yes gene_type:complete
MILELELEVVVELHKFMLLDKPYAEPLLLFIKSMLTKLQKEKLNLHYCNMTELF